jgi:hypothetical protein
MTHIYAQLRKRLRATPAILLSAAAAIAVCAAGTTMALAQQSSAPLLNAPDLQTTVWPAPVGHRQPTQSDLPPSVRKDEGAITQGQRAFTNSLKICRDC